MNDFRRRLRIGVIGGRAADKKTLEAARQVGELIALAGAVLVCGGLGGVMAAAAAGARKADGLTVGILPGNDPAEANAHIDLPIATGLGYTRNSLVAMNSDALIAVDGGYGTLSEIAYGNIYGKPVVGLGTWKIEGVIVAGSPAKAVELALEAAKRRGPMTNTKIVVAYDGTDFCGWQRQPEGTTVQGEIEAALTRIAGKRVAVTGAGRTDAGVHARGQAANFRADFRLANRELERALNAILPDEIRILSLSRVPDGFNARRSAKSKIYQYRIRNAPVVSPFDFRYVHHWLGRLDVEAMARAAGLFVREADFSAFSSNRLLHPVRRIVRSEIRRRGREIVYTVEANGFLRYMVRTIVGTLLEVGRGRMEPLQVEEIFRLNERRLAGPTAPPKGLCLLKVKY